MVISIQLGNVLPLHETNDTKRRVVRRAYDLIRIFKDEKENLRRQDILCRCDGERREGYVCPQCEREFCRKCHMDIVYQGILWAMGGNEDREMDDGMERREREEKEEREEREELATMRTMLRVSTFLDSVNPKNFSDSLRILDGLYFLYQEEDDESSRRGRVSYLPRTLADMERCQKAFQISPPLIQNTYQILILCIFRILVSMTLEKERGAQEKRGRVGREREGKCSQQNNEE